LYTGLGWLGSIAFLVSIAVERAPRTILPISLPACPVRAPEFTELNFGRHILHDIFFDERLQISKHCLIPWQIATWKPLRLVAVQYIFYGGI
jgi:hypothetical protein